MNHISKAIKHQSIATEEISKRICSLRDLGKTSVDIGNETEDTASQVTLSVSNLEVNTGRFRI